MTYTSAQKAWLWLSTIDSVGPMRFAELIARFETPENVWRASAAELVQVVGQSTAEAIRAAKRRDALDKLLEVMERGHIRAVFQGEAEYPPLLRDIVHAPIVLFTRGEPSLGDARTLAVVGTRSCTRYGIAQARRIAYDLSREGVVVVSGLARGIDSAAHLGALDAKARTVAVLGCGVDIAYPPENAQLIEQIIEHGGSVISEYAPGMPPVGANFPTRNRIISGMCAGMLLVEAAEKSGAAHTVNYAMEQGRDVYVLPGPVDARASRLPNLLLREGARAVTCALDILEDQRWPEDLAWAALHRERLASFHAPAASAPQAPKQAQRVSADTLPESARGVVLALREGDLSFDALAENTGISAAALNSILTSLELEGIIKQFPGRIYHCLR